MKLPANVFVTVGLVLGVIATVPSASASAAEELANTTTVTTLASTSSVPLQWNCNEITQADKQKALREGIRMCGLNERAGGVAARGSNTANCGTAYIYVGQAGGKARVDYSLHSTVGIITGRALNVWWGPTAGGSKTDFGGWWGTGFYGNQTDIGFAMKGKKFGATMSGTVTILGWTLSCSVYANEPTRTL